MKQCAARQFENELVERLSILANRHLRPPAPERGPHSMVAPMLWWIHPILNLVRSEIEAPLRILIFFKTGCTEDRGVKRSQD